ncbi:MAG: hypothetical protein ACI97N_002183 [Cognaticolwellia sp.]|jgi:hypothetical protein
MFKLIQLQIALHTLSLHKKRTSWGNAEPYLWNIFFRVDGEAITINPDFTISGKAIFSFSKGSHNNLRGSIHRDNILHIPQDIGIWETELHPIKIPYFEQYVPGIAGVVSVLMEENNVSNEGAEAGRLALSQQVQKAVNDALRDFNPKVIDINDVQNSIANHFQKTIESFSDGIEKHVIEAIKSRQSLLQNVWSLIKADALVGFHVWKFDHRDIETQGGTIHFNHKWNSNKFGDWEVFGKMQELKK